MKTQSCSGALLCAFFFAQSISLFAQGPLTPPGAPAPTMKTLDQVEPRIDLQNAPASAVDTTNAAYHFIINQPGSYYLSANLGVTKTNGIQINAPGVTLDLRGFEIARASGTGGNGIEVTGTAHRARVRNGSIKAFAIGIDGSGGSRGCAFRDVAISGCAGNGIYGFPGAVLEACRVDDNTGISGILIEVGATLIDCTANNNTGSYGIRAEDGATVINCTAYNNTATFGISVGMGSTLLNCSAYGNVGSGGTSAGFSVATGSTATGCSSRSNSSTAATSTPTTGMGFEMANATTIQNCASTFNEGDGIKVTSDCVVRRNLCQANGSSGDGAGIHATSSDNRLDGNNVTDNDRGIDVDAAGNLIIKNAASGNTTTNFDIAANNVFGAIVDRTAPASAAVSGNVAPSSAGTTDPWANFSY